MSREGAVRIALGQPLHLVSPTHLRFALCPCSPLSKTVRFNVLKVEPSVSGAAALKQFRMF